MRLRDAADRLAARLHETVEQFSREELGRSYDRDAFVQQASTSVELVASECLMFGANLFDEDEEVNPLQFRNVVFLEDGQTNRSGRTDFLPGPSPRAAAAIVADYRARQWSSRLDSAQKTVRDGLRSYPPLTALVLVLAGVGLDLGLHGGIEHKTIVAVLALVVGLSGLAAGVVGALSAVVFATISNYVFLEPLLAWPTSCTAKCTLHLALVAAITCAFVKRRELKAFFARRVPA